MEIKSKIHFTLPYSIKQRESASPKDEDEVEKDAEWSIKSQFDSTEKIFFFLIQVWVKEK